MTRLGLRIARLSLALACAALVWACNAPFIPIPPPGQTATFTSALVADEDGGQRTVWVAHGPANQYATDARFYVFDTAIGKGVIAVAAMDGSYSSPPFDGAMGDQVQISYMTPQGALSTRACFLLTTDVDPQSNSAPHCPNMK
jgi:hypothetical protein